MNAVALSISSPAILVGQVNFNGAVPAVAEKLTTFAHALVDRNFDLREVNTTIHDSTQTIFEDAGYLDAISDPLVFAPPRKDLGGYVVDVQVTMHPGPLYRIGSIAIHPEPPLADSDLRAVLPFKTGDPAAASGVRTAVSALAHVYGDHGFLQARASATLDKNVSNHTVNYSFTFSPGAQFHLASIDASALPTELQQEFSSLWHFAPGALVDKELSGQSSRHPGEASHADGHPGRRETRSGCPHCHHRPAATQNSRSIRLNRPIRALHFRLRRPRPQRPLPPIPPAGPRRPRP